MKRALIMLAAFTALALVGTFIGQLSLQRMIEQRLEAEVEKRSGIWLALSRVPLFLFLRGFP